MISTCFFVRIQLVLPIVQVLRISKWKSALKNKYAQIDYFNWLLKWNSRILKSNQLFSGFLQFKSYFARGQRFTIASRSIYQYSNMAPRVSGQTSILVLFSLYPSPAWESRDKRNLRRLERVFRCTRARNLHQDARVSWMNQNKLTGS